MAYYESNGNVYSIDSDGVAHPVEVTAIEKVVTTRELERIEPAISEEKVNLPADARLITLDEIARKFNLSEQNPVHFDKAIHKLQVERLTEETPNQTKPKRARRTTVPKE